MAKLIKQDIGFTQVKNEILNDKNLSLKAKGLFAYLFSKPDGWDFAGDRITLDHSDGRRAVFGTIKELEKSGYLQRKKLSNGRIEYHLKYSEPVAQNSKEAKQQFAKTDSVSNKDSDSNKDVKATSIISDFTKSQGRVINDLIDLFQVVNPSWGQLFKNKNQRKAVERLFAQYGEKLPKIIEFLKVYNAVPYNGTGIITPIELENKMGKVIAFAQQERNKQNKKGKEIIGL